MDKCNKGLVILVLVLLMFSLFVVYENIRLQTRLERVEEIFDNEGNVKALFIDVDTVFACKLIDNNINMSSKLLLIKNEINR